MFPPAGLATLMRRQEMTGGNQNRDEGAIGRSL
jgi:hypothetical protein